MSILYSPMEQFAIVPLYSLEIAGYDLSFSNSSLAMLVAIVAFTLLVSQVGSTKLVPGRFQSVVEMIYEFVFGVVKENLGRYSSEYFPFIFTVFTFIFLNNMFGMIPYWFSPTSHFLVTFAMALSIFIGVTVIGFEKHGLKFFGFFLPSGIPMAMAPFLVFIELVSYCSRPFSLAIRLFANITSGHTLFKIMAGFSLSMLNAGGALMVFSITPVLFLIIISFLETAICAIQAYVYTILTVLYLKDGLYMH